MEEKLICLICGKALTEETANHFDGKVMCNDCFKLKTAVCDCCGERIWEEDARGNSSILLCHHCYEYNYTSCEECGALIHNDNAYYENSDGDYPYCYTCYEKLFKSSIKSYCYKPDPIFYGSGSFYMSIELEIDDGGEDNTNVDELLCIGNFSNVLNGTVDLRNGVLKPHKLENYITKMCPFMYSEGVKSELFKKFLKQTFEDNSLIDYVQRLLGYCITGETKFGRDFSTRGFVRSKDKVPRKYVGIKLKK